jgi:hypothetical protein
VELLNSIVEYTFSFPPNTNSKVINDTLAYLTIATNGKTRPVTENTFVLVVDEPIKYIEDFLDEAYESATWVPEDDTPPDFANTYYNGA